MVSGKHAALLSLPDYRNIFYVQDWSSKGTLANGILVKGQRHRLIEGDVIYFGDRHAKTRVPQTRVYLRSTCRNHQCRCKREADAAAHRSVQVAPANLTQPKAGVCGKSESQQTRE
jgi:hypothetical protein